MECPDVELVFYGSHIAQDFVKVFHETGGELKGIMRVSSIDFSLTGSEYSETYNDVEALVSKKIVIPIPHSQFTIKSPLSSSSSIELSGDIRLNISVYGYAIAVNGPPGVTHVAESSIHLCDIPFGIDTKGNSQIATTFKSDKQIVGAIGISNMYFRLKGDEELQLEKPTFSAKSSNEAATDLLQKLSVLGWERQVLISLSIHISHDNITRCMSYCSFIHVFVMHRKNTILKD